VLAMALAQPPQKNEVSDAELQRLKQDYLPQWAALAYGSAVGKRLPSEVPYVDYMKGSPAGGIHDEEPDHWVCNLIDASIDEITPRLPVARAALSARYVRGAREPSPAVYRSCRTGEPVKLHWVDDIADRAELMLVAVVKRRGLPL
jgi:hypothetical protein